MFVSPALVSEPFEREVFVSNELQELLFGPWDSVADEMNGAKSRQAIDEITTGRRLVVKLKGHIAGTSFISRLVPQTDEVWEIRVRDPRPGLRILGRFADKDLFIAFHWYLRTQLKGRRSKAFANAIVDCKAAWDELFPNRQPHSGNTVDDYLTNATNIRSIGR